ncbi:MAG: hypothetical protein ACI9FU_000104 [Granulosicoccus sp.]|jgi:hypothetical protein
MKSLSQKISEFNQGLELKVRLPQGFDVMNPFQGSNAEQIKSITESFYAKFYNDSGSRNLILGINPGRLGAGATGLPFTDTKRLNSDCGIEFSDFELHEPSSVFVYEVIRAFGGVQKFYSEFYINSVCPLGFLRLNEKANWVNANYYDDKNLFKAVRPFIIESLKAQIDWGIRTDKIWCMGSGLNFKFLTELNKTEKLFGEIVKLDHPRYVVQYKSKEMDAYVGKYLDLLS